MNIKKLFFSILIWFLIVFIQSIFPAFEFRGISIQPDLLLVLLTYVALSYSGTITLVFGFINGLIQDFATQASLIGILAMSKTIAAYLLYFLVNYKKIWTRKLKLSWIYGTYFFHFFIYSYFYLRDKEIGILIAIDTILIHSILSFSIFILLQKLIGKSRTI